MPGRTDKGEGTTEPVSKLGEEDQWNAGMQKA